MKLNAREAEGKLTGRHTNGQRVRRQAPGARAYDARAGKTLLIGIPEPEAEAWAARINSSKDAFR
ncbi:MAG TPA: hypothetical protein VF573_23850 [Paraburkholderia sp.]|uniref:hypothetical protein n=1 Tax=Paraburkholderia sp. TaxID=1926495 RepID=UPI002ED2DBE2